MLSIKRLKGPIRPVQDETARSAVLASVASVDLMFRSGKILRMRLYLRPDIVVKGADYRLDPIARDDIVRAYGGKAMLAEMVPGYSTTIMVARMGQSA
jgi:D-beta-D-heptose 7-phosphate kinase / D-beta-D-heptose 1-phosphate adenosyltransferase